jgi:hypothetical protein
LKKKNQRSKFPSQEARKKNNKSHLKKWKERNDEKNKINDREAQYKQKLLL